MIEQSGMFSPEHWFEISTGVRSIIIRTLIFSRTSRRYAPVRDYHNEDIA
jgi:hypothetical protein